MGTTIIANIARIYSIFRFEIGGSGVEVGVGVRVGVGVPVGEGVGEAGGEVGVGVEVDS